MTSIKIIYIDYWTKGVHNFLRIDKELRNYYETMLLHMGSWRDGTYSKEVHIDGLRVRDISCYSTNYLFKVLERERPNAVILLNLNTITDRSIVLSCKKLGIRVIYLSHGSLNGYDRIGDLLKSGHIYYNNFLDRVRRSVVRVFPDYCYSMRRHGCSVLSILHSVIRHLYNYGDPVRHHMFPKYSHELDTDICLVFSKNDFDVFVEYRGFPKDKVIITGNPEYDEFFNGYDEHYENKKTKVVYIDEGSIDDILTIEEHIRFLREVRDIVLKNNLEFVIKLHPRIYNRIDVYRKALPTSVVSTHVDFFNLFKDAKIAISQGSTVVLYAMSMSIPIVVPRFGGFLKYPEYYPRETVIICNSLNELELCIKEPKMSDKQYSDYLSRFVTYQDNMSLQRILENIKRHVQIDHRMS